MEGIISRFDRQTDRQTDRRTDGRTDGWTDRQTHAHTHTNAHTYTYTHKRTNTRAHKHTHANIHTPVYLIIAVHLIPSLCLPFPLPRYLHPISLSPIISCYLIISHLYLSRVSFPPPQIFRVQDDDGEHGDS